MSEIPPARAQARQGRQIVAHGDSRGDAAVVNTSARVSGRQSRLQWSIVSVAPAGARFLFCFFFPWLAPWATFCRRYAACIRSLLFPMVCFGQPARTRGSESASRGSTPRRSALRLLRFEPFAAPAGRLKPKSALQAPRSRARKASVVL